jgi:hypothetical protein
MMNKNIQFNKGYTLLFAVIVSSLVLSVGISILNISKKEFLLSSSARESTIAFYAADSGLECAIYHDFKRNSFINPPKTLKCNNQDIMPELSANTFSFDYYLDSMTSDLNNKSCARITVIKGTDYTDFESRGYNMGWDTTNNRCDLPSPKRVERAINYHYSYID